MKDKRRVHENNMQNIFELWNWHWYDKIKQLDHMTRRIISDFKTAGVPPDMWQPFLQHQLLDAVEQIAEQAEKEGKDEKKPSTRLPSSLTALRSIQARNKVTNVD